MRVISPQYREESSAPPGVDSAFSQQMAAVVEDFAMAYGQRESMSHALMKEKELAGQFADVLSSVLEDNVAGTLRTACNVLTQKCHEAFGAGSHAADARMQRYMTRELIAVEALAFMARRRALGSAAERCELVPLLKQAVARLQPLCEAGAGGLGISECHPGVRVASSTEGVRHLLLNLFVEILCQTPDHHIHAIAMRCNESIAEVTVSVPGASGKRSWEWDMHSPGVQVATGLARELGIVLTLSSSSAFDCRLEFAILSDA